MLREQLGIGVYGAEDTRIQDRITEEYEDQAGIIKLGDEQINSVTSDVGTSDEKNTIASQYQHYRIPSFKEQRRQYYKPSEPYVPKTGFVYPED